MEVLIQCDAGTYELQSGIGKTFTQDPGCGSSHCDVYQQVVATIEVVSTQLPRKMLLSSFPMSYGVLCTLLQDLAHTIC